MRKSCIFILGIIFMLSGCSLSNGSDIPSEAESIESADITEETSDQSGNDGAPAGISDTQISSAVETELSGVSLVKDDYDYIRDMVSFDGEIVPFEELGFELYTFSDAVIPEINYTEPNAVDKELLYYFEYDNIGGYGWQNANIVLQNVYEYDLLSGTVNTIDMAGNCTGILYIDRDYILYYYLPDVASESGVCFYLLDRATGEKIDASDIEAPFQVRPEGKVVRCGSYLFFTRVENMSTEDGGYNETMELLVRYSISRNESQIVSVAELLGATEEEVIAAPIGGSLEQIHYTLDSFSFNAAPNQLYFGGDGIGYVAPIDRSAVFGERYEVGRVLPMFSFSSADQNIYKPILTANYGTIVDNVVITGQSVAVVRLRELNSSESLLIVDTRNHKAAVFPCEEGDYGEIKSDGDWIYFPIYNGVPWSQFVAINTGS